MRRWKGPSAELCDDSRPRTSPVQRQVAGGLLKRSAVPLFTRIATSVLTGAPTAPEWVHPLRARQPAPRAAQRSHNVPVSHRPTLTVTVVSAVALALELSLSIGLPHPVHHLVSACPATQLRPQANDLDNTQHWPVKSPHNPTQHRSKDKPRTRGIGHSVATVDQTEDSHIRDNRHYHR